MIDALVLAGSPNTGALQTISKEPYEALIKIGPRPMLQYVLKALQNSGQVKNITVVGPAEIRPYLPPEVSWLAAGHSLMENLQRGSEQMEGRFLLATADIPLLTPEAVRGFLKLCGNRGADLYFPVIPRTAVEGAYPTARRTYVRFKEGTFTGGNLFLVNPRVVAQCMAVGQELVSLRKSPLALARRVGFSLLAKLLLRILTLKEVEAKASRLLGIQGRVVLCPYPEVGMDVDKPLDLDVAERVLDFAKIGQRRSSLYVKENCFPQGHSGSQDQA